MNDDLVALNAQNALANFNAQQWSARVDEHTEIARSRADAA